MTREAHKEKKRTSGKTREVQFFMLKSRGMSDSWSGTYQRKLGAKAIAQKAILFIVQGP